MNSYYMRYVIVCCVLILALCLSTPTLAQEHTPDDTGAVTQPLTAIYTALDGSFSFHYPAEWDLFSEEDRIVSFYVLGPASDAANEQAPNVRPRLAGITITLETHLKNEDMSAVVQQAFQPLLEENDDAFIARPPTPLLINDHPSAIGDVAWLMVDFRFIAMQISAEQYIRVALYSAAGFVPALSPTIYDVLGTVRLEGDTTPISPVRITWVAEPLTEEYIRPDNRLLIRYPAGWELEERGTYTLLFFPNLISINFSTEDLNRHNIAMRDVMDDFITSVTDQYPQYSATNAISFQVNERPALRVDLVDETVNIDIRYILVALDDAENGEVAVVSIAGDMATIQRFEITIENILAALEQP